MNAQIEKVNGDWKKGRKKKKINGKQRAKISKTVLCIRWFVFGVSLTDILWIRPTKWPWNKTWLPKNYPFMRLLQLKLFCVSVQFLWMLTNQSLTIIWSQNQTASDFGSVFSLDYKTSNFLWMCKIIEQQDKKGERNEDILSVL